MAPEARTLTIGIDSLAVGGDGVGRADGKVCFVPFAVPGDRVVVRVVRERRRALWGRIVAVEAPSPKRREPSCGLFGVCGGCAWMNVDYGEQLSAKRAMVSRAVGLPDTEIVGSPRILGYRRLARLHAGLGVTGEAAFGFMAAGAGGIVDVRSCPVLEPALCAVLEPVAGAVLSEAGRGLSLEVRLAGGSGGVIASLESRGPLPPGVYDRCAGLVPAELAGLVASADGVRGLVAGADHVVIAGGDGRPLTAPAGGFGQANGQVNLELARTVAQWVGAGGHETALELFAGAGNLSVALAPLVGRLDTGELDGQA
jgi:23S rRNA (uracil1939-C5)-methyltransferase